MYVQIKCLLMVTTVIGFQNSLRFLCTVQFSSNFQSPFQQIFLPTETFNITFQLLNSTTFLNQ